MSLPKEKFIEFWYSNLTVKELAIAHDLRPGQILKEWRQLKLDGRLPTEDRPRSRQSYLYREVSNIDGRPGIDEDYDPLLEQLKLHHKVKSKK